MSWVVVHHLVNKKPLSQVVEAIGYEFHPGGNFCVKIHDEDGLDVDEIIDFCYPSNIENIG